MLHTVQRRHLVAIKGSLIVPCMMAVLLVNAGAMVSCRDRQVVIEFTDSPEHVFSRDERRLIEDVAERTIPDVRRVLPGLPANIVLRVKAGKGVSPYTGESGTAGRPNLVDWTVDANRKEGVAGVVRAQLRPTLFHELHHLVRSIDLGPASFAGLRNALVREGLATAFERDFGGADPPWGQYPSDVSSWTTEVLALPDDVPEQDQWFHWHPDGRHWIGYRVGTYLADCAKRATGKTSANLVGVPAQAVIAMCPTSR